MAADMFMKIESPSIEGESKVPGHEKEIEILSFSWSVSQTGTFSAGGGGGAGIAAFGDASFSKYTDKASKNLFLHCAKGTHIPEVIFVSRKAGGEQEDYIKLTFTDVLISSYQTSGSGGDTPVESFSLNYSKLQFEHREQKQDGSMEGWAAAGYDVKKREEVK